MLAGRGSILKRNTSLMSTSSDDIEDGPGKYTIDTGARDSIYEDMRYKFESHHQEPCLVELKKLGKHVPMWSLETNTSGGRKYFLQSYEKMWQQLSRTNYDHAFFYESIVADWPCHACFDIDLDHGDFQGESPPNIAAALDAWMVYARHVFEDLASTMAAASGAYKKPFEWDDVPHWTKWSVLVSDRKDKDSRHYTFRMPNNCMFASLVQFGHFHNAVVRRSIDSTKGNIHANPMLYINRKGEVKGVLDNTIYTRHRQFRTYRSTKMKYRSMGHLLPEGVSMKDAPEKDSFFRNLVCYVPLDPAGNPIPQTIINVPSVDNPVLKRHSHMTPGEKPTLVMQPKMSASASGSRTFRAPSIATSVFQTARNQGCADFGSDDDMSDTDSFKIPTIEYVGLREVFEATASLTAVQTGHNCTVTHVGGNGRYGAESGIINSENRTCPYSCRTHNHPGNHLFYTCTARYPRPGMTVWCHDKVCIDDIKNTQVDKRTRLRLSVKRDDVLGKAIRGYMRSQKIKPGMLTRPKENAD